MIEYSLVTSLENKIYFLPFWITSSSSFVRNFSPEYNRNETTVNSDNIIRVLNIKKFVLRNDLNFSPSWKLGWNDSIYRSQPWPSQTFFKILPATRLIPFSRHCFPPELWTPAHNTKLGLIADTLSHETLEKELNKTSSSSSRIIIENAIREKWNGDTDLRLVSRLTTASPSPLPSFPYRFQAINSQSFRLVQYLQSRARVGWCNPSVVFSFQLSTFISGIRRSGRNKSRVTRKRRKVSRNLRQTVAALLQIDLELMQNSHCKLYYPCIRMVKIRRAVGGVEGFWNLGRLNSPPCFAGGATLSSKNRRKGEFIRAPIGASEKGFRNSQNPGWAPRYIWIPGSRRWGPHLGGFFACIFISDEITYSYCWQYPRARLVLLPLFFLLLLFFPSKGVGSQWVEPVPRIGFSAD